MKFQKIIIQLVFALSVCIKVSAQVAPPPIAMPVDSNVLLVDKIIEVTNHENYFKEYCTKKVLAYSKENNWTQEKTDEILSSVKFEYYNSTIYNSYAFFKTDQLKRLLSIMTEISKEKRNSQVFILTNSMMQSNLDLFVKTVIEGKYVVKKSS